MTANQIAKKLQNAGLDISKMEITRDEVTVCIGYYEVKNGSSTFGGCNERQTKTLANKVAKTLGWKHGYRISYGAQVVTPDACAIDTGNCL